MNELALLAPALAAFVGGVVALIFVRRVRRRVEPQPPKTANPTTTVFVVPLAQNPPGRSARRGLMLGERTDRRLN